MLRGLLGLHPADLDAEVEHVEDVNAEPLALGGSRSNSSRSDSGRHSAPSQVNPDAEREQPARHRANTLRAPVSSGPSEDSESTTISPEIRVTYYPVEDDHDDDVEDDVSDTETILSWTDTVRSASTSLQSVARSLTI